jgi:hypothetical protein
MVEGEGGGAEEGEKKNDCSTKLKLILLYIYANAHPYPRTCSHITVCTPTARETFLPHNPLCNNIAEFSKMFKNWTILVQIPAEARTLLCITMSIQTLGLASSN